jgi:hypothetical protein
MLINQTGFSFVILLITISIFIIISGAFVFFYLPAAKIQTENMNNEIMTEDTPASMDSPTTDYSLIQEKYNLDDSQIETLSQIDSTRL